MITIISTNLNIKNLLQKEIYRNLKKTWSPIEEKAPLSSPGKVTLAFFASFNCISVHSEDQNTICTLLKTKYI